MKKRQMFCGFTFAALALLTSCSSEETLDVPIGNPIEFAYSNVDASTRTDEGNETTTTTTTSTTAEDPSFTTKSLQNKGFIVYGWVAKNSASALLFDGVSVSYSTTDSKWGYTNTQYWVDGGKYTFMAIAGNNGTVAIKSDDGKTAASAPAITGFSSDGKTDLIFAAPAAYTGSQSAQTVNLTFKHQLAKAKFTFTDGMPSNSNITIKVTGIKISDAVTGGDVKLSTSSPSWTPSATTGELSFGDALQGDGYISSSGTQSQYERIMIPVSSKEYSVSFSTDIYQKDIKIKTATHTAKITVTLEGGKAYNFTAKLDVDNVDGGSGLNPIVFDETVSDWGDSSNTAVTDYPKSTTGSSDQSSTDTSAAAPSQSLTVAEGAEIF
jgi:hypothetical protein